MSDLQDNTDYRLSPRKSLRTPKKKRRSQSPVSLLPKKRSKVIAEVEVAPLDVLEDQESGSQHEEEEFIVLPSRTSSGEQLTMRSNVIEGDEEEEEEGVERVYSSLPPDITIDQILRVTRSAVQGEQLRITRNESSQLRIISETAVQATSESESNYHTRLACQCVVCERRVEAGEMFLNFPDDLDRRRIWGNLLGFRYQDMLRVKSRMVTIGAICTDHFAEQCFRMYNFNKAAIEALGVPKHLSPVKSPMKRKPWSCTICTFASYSPSTTYNHLINTHISDPNVPNSVEGQGYSCPFCRKCTYGYKTVSGFRRHIESSPIEHCHLKRVYEISREMCRSHYLEPATEWASWTEDNVALAYYGFIPPKKALFKRRPGTEPNSPIKSPAALPKHHSAAPTPLKESMQSATPPPEESSSSSSDPPPTLPRQSNAAPTLADVLADVSTEATSSDAVDDMGMSRVLSEPLDPHHLKRWISSADIRVSKRQIEAAQARQRLFGDCIPSDDIVLPRSFVDPQPKTYGTAFQRLTHVADGVVSDLSRNLPLVTQPAYSKPRVAILRSKLPQ